MFYTWTIIVRLEIIHDPLPVLWLIKTKLQIKLEKTARICPLLCENSETDIIIYYQENSTDNNCSRVYRLIIDYLINHASPNGVHTLMNVRKEKYFM